MRVDDRLRKGVVFVGAATGHGPFVPHGTGFVVVNFIDDQGFQNIVTARHVIDRIKGNIIHVRLNTREGTALVAATEREHWHPHPDKNIDVAVCTTVFPKDRFDLMHFPTDGPLILTDEVIRKENIGTGDEVFTAGMFVSRIGETKNIPIIRSGIISAMPEEKIRTEFGYHHAYLVEARSIDGLSGSPVFVSFPPFRYDANQVKMSQYSHFLMGMMLGHNQVQNPDDTIEIVEGGNHGDPKARRDLVRIPLNTGIGVVLPFSYVVEAIEQPILMERRRATIVRDAQKRGFVADSAQKAPTKDENPRHKEDFTSLLDAATRGKKPTDRT